MVGWVSAPTLICKVSEDCVGVCVSVYLGLAAGRAEELIKGGLGDLKNGLQMHV